MSNALSLIVTHQSQHLHLGLISDRREQLILHQLQPEAQAALQDEHTHTHTHTQPMMILLRMLATTVTVMVAILMLMPCETLAFVPPTCIRSDLAVVAMPRPPVLSSSNGGGDFWEKQKQLVEDMNASAEKSLRA